MRPVSVARRQFYRPPSTEIARGLDEVATWQNRPLEPVYPLIFFDALRVKVRDEGLVRNKAVHIARGVGRTG